MSKQARLSVPAFMILSILGGLMGCTTFQPKPLSPQKTAQTLLSRRLDDSHLKTFVEQVDPSAAAHWPPAVWSLRELTFAALYFHPDLDVARAQWAVARGGIVTAGERPNPTVGFSPGFNANPGNLTPWIMGLTLDFPIETAGKRQERKEASGHLAEAARLRIGDMAWQVRKRLREQFLNLYAALESVRLQRKQQSLLQGNWALLARRSSEGIVSPFDATQARLLLDQSSLALKEAEKQASEAKAQLAQATGISAIALEQVAFDFSLFDRPLTAISFSTATLQEQAVLNRTDLLASLADYAAAESLLHLEIRKQYPDIHLGPGYTYDQGQSKWALGLTLTLPILNQNKGPIAEANARRQEAAARFVALQAQVIGSLERTERGWAASISKWLATRNISSQLKDRDEKLGRLWRSGETGRTAKINATIEESAAEVAELNARVAGQQTLGALEDALQKPVEAIALPAVEKTPERGVR